MSRDNGILIWREQEDWNKTVCTLLESFSQPLRKIIEENPKEHFYYDTEWCEEQGIQLKNGKELPGFQELLAGIAHIYGKIRLFHACRTVNVSSYLNDGILPLDIDKQIEIAKTLFVCDRFPLVKEDHINDVVLDLADEHRGGKTYFSLDDRVLVGHDHLYLNYGSEYLTVIASRLPGGGHRECMEFLRTIGKPTIFVCDIPINWVEKRSIFHLVEDLVEWTIKYPYTANDDTQISRTFTFNVAIPPTFITSYYHPA